MKKTIIFASVALATLFALSSCQKESLPNNESTNGVRIITAEFENNATKTELNDDGKTPEWKLGDKIMLLNYSGQQEIEIISGSGTPSDGKAYINGTGLTISTHLDKTLYAVYPASATTMTSCTDGNINFTIPAVQDGTFASANICVAKSMEDDETNKDNLVFSNATSVLEFSQTASSTQVLRVAVTAANAIAGKLTASFGDNNKATISTDGLTGKIIFTTAAATAQDKYYVAVAPVETGDITFNYYKAVEEKSESKTTKTLALNKIYALTIPTTTYEDSYVVIGVKKWAKCNIGATTVAGSYATCTGDYYQWGSINTIYESINWNGSSATFTWKSDKTSGFADANREYKGNAATLPAAYDVVIQKIGNGWHMPTSDDFTELYNACGNSNFDATTNPTGPDFKVSKGIYWCTAYEGIAGYLFCDGNNKLFFPAAGCYDENFNSVGTRGCYWSSTITSNTAYAYRMELWYGKAEYPTPKNMASLRHRGYPVRPVLDIS